MVIYSRQLHVKKNKKSCIVIDVKLKLVMRFLNAFSISCYKRVAPYSQAVSWENIFHQFNVWAASRSLNPYQLWCFVPTCTVKPTRLFCLSSHTLTSSRSSREGPHCSYMNAVGHFSSSGVVASSCPDSSFSSVQIAPLSSSRILFGLLEGERQVQGFILGAVNSCDNCNC